MHSPILVNDDQAPSFICCCRSRWTAILPYLLLVISVLPLPHHSCQAFVPHATTTTTRSTANHHSYKSKQVLPLGLSKHRHIQKSNTLLVLRALPSKTKGQQKPSTNSSQKQEKDPDDEDLIWGLPRQSVFQPLVILLLSQFLLFIGVGAVIPSIPLYGKEIGLSGAANGIVISAPALALLVLAQSSGKLADQARKPAMMGGMAIIVASDIGTAVATSLPTLILARLGLGAGRGISEAGERGMLADLAKQVPALRGRALAAQQAVVALGIAIGAPLGGVVVETYGPRASFLCVSAAAFVALLMYGFLPETTTSLSADSPNNTNPQKENGSNTSKEVVKWATLLQDNQWRGLALCQCGASFGFAAKIASIPIIATAVLPGGAIGAGALLSAAGLSGLVGAPVGGWITDQAGAKFAAIVSGLFSATALIAIPLALSPSSSSWMAALQQPLLATYSTPLGDTTGAAIGFCSLVIAWSTAVAAQGPAMTALAQELAPAGSEATSLALPRAAGDGTYIVAPFLLGIVADKFVAMPGTECAVAGSAALLGAIALATLGSTEQK